MLRIDDSDSFRNVKGAAENIITTLDDFGLYWDGDISYQQNNQEHYRVAIKYLLDCHLVYPCTCTRKALALNPSKTYPKTCLTSIVKDSTPHSLRIKSKDITICFNDQLQTQQIEQLANQHGDFIIRRKDNIIAYQLAVVIDDHLEKINHVVRGFDLLDSTPKQIYLQQLLGYKTPQYCHIPVITDLEGDKLSKQSFAEGVSSKNPEKTLLLLLELLAQSPPKLLKTASVHQIIDWAIDHWKAEPLKKIRAISNRID